MTDKEKYVNVAELKKKVRYWAKTRGMSNLALKAFFDMINNLPVTVKCDLETTLEEKSRACEAEMNDKLRLAMRAGAFAIRNSKKYQSGWFRSGDEKIPWLEAEKILLCTAEGLNPDECEIKHE